MSTIQMASDEQSTTNGDRAAISLPLIVAVPLFLLALYAGLSPYFLNACLCLDDAYIYLSAARNLLDGYGPVINAGDSHSGATSGMWVLILSGTLNFLDPIEELEQRVRVFSSVILAAAGLICAIRLRSIIGEFAYLAPIAIFSSTLLSIFLGMETALAMLLIVAVSSLASEARRPLICGLFIGLGYLARAELALFAPIALLAWTIGSEPVALFFG